MVNYLYDLADRFLSPDGVSGHVGDRTILEETIGRSSHMTSCGTAQVGAGDGNDLT
jgi:hypothetical protein